MVQKLKNDKNRDDSLLLSYDTIGEFNVDSKAECHQLNLAHETKTSKRQCPLSSVQVQYPRSQSGRNKKTMEERTCEKMNFKSGVKD